MNGNDMCPKLAISERQSKGNKYAVDAQKFNNEYCNIGLEAIEKAKTSEDTDEAIQKLTLPPGTFDLEYYTSVAKAFVGLNPISGDGSGFIYKDMTDPTSFGNVPSSGGGRNNLCTCACEPSDSSVGCAGHARSIRDGLGLVENNDGGNNNGNDGAMNDNDNDDDDDEYDDDDGGRELQKQYRGTRAAGSAEGRM